MIFAAVDARFWRLLSIRWQEQPLSGEGASRTGGRWNRRGSPALYLAADHATAIAEFHQQLVRPGTLAGYDVQSSAVADLTDEAALDDLGVDRKALLCGWRTIFAVNGGTPPTWPLADRMIDAGAHGALVPSAQNPGGANLVLWRWSDRKGEGARVRLADPEGDLRRR